MTSLERSDDDEQGIGQTQPEVKKQHPGYTETRADAYCSLGSKEQNRTELSECKNKGKLYDTLGVGPKKICLRALAARQTETTEMEVNVTAW